MKIKLIVISVLAIIFSLNTHATTVLYKNFDNLVDESDHVVGGTVENMRAKKHKDGEIYTVVTLKDGFIITETGKAATNKPIKIRYKGGEVAISGKTGVEGSHANGTPEMTVGEQVILFISNNGVADMPIYGWGQGLFHIDEAEGVSDTSRFPIVALDGSHLVRKMPNGLLSDRKTSSKRSASQGTDAVLINSDGGEDMVISNAQANVAKLDEISSYSAMHVSNFVSMIQERKAIKTKQYAKSRKDPAVLFTLPDVSRAQAYPSGNANNSLINPAMLQAPANKEPTQPISKPRHIDKGK